MLKTVLALSAVALFMVASVFNFYAASVIRHDVADWQLVQASVVFVGICYACMSLAVLHIVRFH